MNKRHRPLPYAAFVSMLFVGGAASAHDVGSAGLPVCLESNLMIADAMNAPFATANGPGRVLEVNIITGEPGIAFNNPFTPEAIGTELCPDEVACPGPFKPTGVLSGGIVGHAFLTSAAQHALIEFHRDGTPIRTAKLPLDEDPGFGTVPRLLGTQVMPNGNIIQAVCDANFFNASNSDQNPDGSNRSNNFFPPVYSTPERAANSRLLVLDEQTLEVVDEYSMPKAGSLGADYWGCPAGILFSDEGMFVSTFHGAAVLVIDWVAGLNNRSEGYGSNKVGKKFKFGKKKNRADVLRVIDFRPDEPADAASRRDSLRAISLDEGGNLYATDRGRSRDCLEGEIPGAATPCDQGVFRQRVDVVPFGEDHPAWTIALDPGVNVIAGLRINRMSALGCATVDPGGADPDLCNVETLYVASSAFNPGCELEGGVPSNPCFVPGGGVGEYLIDPLEVDDPATCTGDPVGDNSGCTLPIATYLGPSNGHDAIDPRMLMPIHEAFVQ